MSDADDVLARWRAGEPGAREEIDAELYAQLKRLARHQLAGGGAPSLSATALVHEAVMRLMGGPGDVASRAHLLAIAALKMRAVLVDHARARQAVKRGEGAAPITLGAADDVHARNDQEFLDLHVALEALARDEPRAASVIEQAYFGGLSAGESALALGVSVATVERDLAFARAYLRSRLVGG